VSNSIAVLRRGLDVLPDDHADFAGVEAALNATKVRMAAAR